MATLAICASILLCAFIVSVSINYGANLISRQLDGIVGNLSEISKILTDLELKQRAENMYQADLVKNLYSLKKILAKNFRIAFNDEEFEKL